MGPATKLATAIFTIFLIGPVAGPALGFDRSGFMESGFYYSDLEIVQGDPVPFNTGGIGGDIRYVTPYNLSGKIENAENHPRSEVRVRFTATDCSGDKLYWSVMVNVGPLGPNETFRFLQKIADVEPTRPCGLEAKAYCQD